MARASRKDTIRAGYYYHVLARGNDGRLLFSTAADYDYYLERIETAQKRTGVSLFHFVLMPNHVHLLLSPSADDLSAFMHGIQMPFAKRYCKLSAFAGHVWQDRYKSILITSDAYLLACGNYIEMNPVRSGLVQNPEGWKCSSYGYYAFGMKSDIITPTPLYRSLGGNDTEQQGRYRSLITQTRAV